ncbi:diaminopimelate epimerase [Desulfogranum mediterraneum]|uniref:diaminopimelate epimerase n=1 Tax=Desulfogranum mediterraneum TaxID=160661 RepID=UPI000424707A|nr:diaminopimelate epimerase [Desulfogranum mediterraneum]
MQIAQCPIPFVKMSGAGNDFIIIDHRSPLIAPQDQAEFARLVCRRRFSVGADGLFLLEESETADFKWHFYNADGSMAEMCGNGARCVARFAYMHGLAPASMRFETLAGIVEAKVADVQVAVRMPPAHSLTLCRGLEVDGQVQDIHFVDTGVPHVVSFVDDLDSVDVVARGRLIRNHPEFAPAGTNVNFVVHTTEGLRVRTYERGVEDETMACGTGAVACALVATRLGLVKPPVEVVTAGNERLTIQISPEPGGEGERLLLQGPARIIYKGELNRESLHG